jgi:Bacterial regulatory helix-turn-helix protein, lysR family
MEMQQVRYFLALCGERNFTRAARRCAVTQPTLTIAIRQLEAELGGPLFKRAGRTSTLSALGAAVHPHIEAVDQAVAGARREADAVLAAAAAPPPAPAEPFPLFKLKESVMRKIAVVAALAAVLLLVIGVTVHGARQAGASAPAVAGAAADAYAVERTIDVKALPTVDPLSEADPSSPDAD